VKGELEPGERLLWAGRSAPPPAPLGQGYFIAGFVALLLLGVGVLIIAYAMGDHFRAHANRESPVPFGIILCGLGCATILGTIGIWFSNRAERRRQACVWYAVTDRRAILWTPERGSDAVRVQSVRRGEIRYVVRLERPDGSGDLEFTASPG